MTRLETDINRLEERLVAAEVGRAWNLIFVKNDDYAAVDWHITNKDGTYYGSAELKRRDALPTTYSTIMLSEEKLKALLALANRAGTSYFIVKFNDNTIWSVDVKTLPPMKAEIGGRKDRGGVNPHDIELVVYIPMSSFTKVDTENASKT